MLLLLIILDWESEEDQREAEPVVRHERVGRERQRDSEESEFTGKQNRETWIHDFKVDGKISASAHATSSTDSANSNPELKRLSEKKN